MKKQVAYPTLVSSLRIAALPLFLYLFNMANITACMLLLAFCAASDYFDGYIAKKLFATTRFGAYYDATTDFILMIGLFTLFFEKGDYPIWLLLLIAVSFIQFIVTSFLSKKLYDPVGRYLGSALYIGVALTLLWPTLAIFIFVQYAFAVFFLISIVSRTISLTRKKVKITPN
jgi:phosphatidylglycerophosphate synthase